MLYVLLSNNYEFKYIVHDLVQDNGRRPMIFKTLFEFNIGQRAENKINF